MKILQVIHGYPMRYNAGSEVYTRTLSQGLAKHHHVHVFTREEDAFAPDARLRIDSDPDDSRITLHVVNNPRNRDRYRVPEIDCRFGEVLDRFSPDIVHIGHLNHLSTSLVNEAARRGIPLVHTLHDYWLMCPRGQFMQTFPEHPQDLWTSCPGQDDRRCAERCYARYYSGAPEEHEADCAHWTHWVARRMAHVRELAEQIDLFIAPSHYLLERYRDAFGLPEHKLHYLDYGFDRERLSGRQRTPDEPFTFGYIGTHIPAKGIQDLIRAFGAVHGNVRLRIWGRPRGQDTAALKALADELPQESGERIEWCREYCNQNIVPDVFDRVDAIVVPSIWVENSPLVIHEAQQARVPVVTANAGGMAEYVHHEVNGLLFEHRSPDSLTACLQRLADDPALALRLGAKGYLFDAAGNVPDINEHVQEIETLYKQVITRSTHTRDPDDSGPWRITFDTNPDTCNLHCIMCEEHSPDSARQTQRKIEGRKPRTMPFELIERIVAEAAPHGLREIIPSTMGEPLLYEHFDAILALCKSHGIKLNLTTNGTFPKARNAREWAAQIVPVTSDVKISLNGATSATQESIMLGTDMGEICANLRDFIEVRDHHAEEGGNRCRVTLQMTFMECNVGELADIVRMAIEFGVDRVKGHHVWTHSRQLEEQSLHRNRESRQRWNAAVRAARAAANERLLPNGKRIELDNLHELPEKEREDSAPDAHCPFLGREAWISASGRFDPCCAPDEQRRELGDFGNLHDQTLLEIWHGGAYRELIKTYSNHPLCRTCTLRRPQEKSQ